MKYKIIRISILLVAIALLAGCSFKAEIRKPWKSKNVTDSLVKSTLF